MSKLGKKIIEIPEGVTVDIDNQTIKVTGPKGMLSVLYKGKVKISSEDKIISVLPLEEKNTQFQGLYRTLIVNMIQGVKDGVDKKLEFNGIGYRANVDGGDLVLTVGYSHPVRMKRVEGISFAVSDNVITVSGMDKVLVGDIAAKIRAVRPPDPYKGKGIRYLGEEIIKKEVKSAK